MLPEKWVVVHEPLDVYFKDFRKWFLEQHSKGKHHLTAHWLSYYFDGKRFLVTDEEIRNEDFIKLTPKQVLEMIEQQDIKRVPDGYKEEWIPKRGDIVEVGDTEIVWYKRRYIGTLKESGAIIATELDDDWTGESTFKGYIYAFVRPFKNPIIEITLEEIAKLKGVDVSQIRIKE